MNIVLKSAIFGVGLGALVAAPSRADAALTAFQTFVGNVGVSSDGWGSTSNSGQVSAEVPAGSTVLGAWIYNPTFFGGTPTGISFAGTNVPAASFTALGIPSSACCQIEAYRANVTSLVAPLINAGPGGLYNFDVTKSGSTDGIALVVAYSNPTLPTATVGILDGNASVAGEVTTVNFAQPLNPSTPGFFAEMRLGIGFSCCGQRSSVTVNGTLITENAGNNDDGVDGGASNGNLITVGGVGDLFSPLLPNYTEDTERYNLVPQIGAGDTSITIRTSNASRDDNIFLAIFYTSGIAGINEPPPPPPGVPAPAAALLFGAGLLGLGLTRSRR